MATVLKHPRYNESVSRRCEDPIVVEMYRQLKKYEVSPAEETQNNEWHFIQTVNNRFRSQGGTGQESIGEIAEALVELERRDA